MLQLQTFTFNPFQENTYLIINDKKQCWIIDPGMYDSSETNFFFSFIEENQLTPQSIINTHAHIDHIFGVQSCKDKYGIPFSIHEKELPVLYGAKGSAALFGFDFNEIPQPEAFIKENVLLKLGDDSIEVRLTPGHSPGSIVFYYSSGKWLVGGDILFNGSIGRTDLPGGDFETLINSIRTQVFTLSEETTVYPGHGSDTTLAQEKAYNPFLKDI